MTDDHCWHLAELGETLLSIPPMPEVVCCRCGQRNHMMQTRGISEEHGRFVEHYIWDRVLDDKGPCTVQNAAEKEQG
jgi:hypothetical protein